MAQPITLSFYRRCLRSLRVLSSTPKEGLSFLDPKNESESRTNYYRSWTQENILSHTEIGGENLLNAIKRGEESRVWILKKYNCKDNLPPFDWSRFDDLKKPSEE
mmetsp:Transcript_4826/g.9690  ORF Transcript_4826/g.9690 Transcript_4826/m.9690 type:complete len:105 (-) Transcript_4826:1317-1631(-)